MEFLNKKQKIIVGGITILMCTIIIYYIFKKTEPNNYEEFEFAEDFEEEIVKNDYEKEKIVVHISGEVKNQGIIQIEEGARIADAIEKAGGATEEADLSKVNLAYEIKDGQKINIPNKAEENIEYIEEEAGENVLENNIKHNKININNATQTELETLSGIGPSTALKIIDYRNKNGEFKQIEDIKEVPTIGDAKFENIKDSICVK